MNYPLSPSACQVVHAGPGLRLITLEDRGQDFTHWVIDANGVVVECGPFQGWLWNGTKVHNEKVKRGIVLDITTKNGERTTLNYRVKSCRAIDRIESQESAAMSGPAVRAAKRIAEAG